MTQTHGSVRPQLHYGWIAAGVTFLTLLAAAGARATPSVILLPIGNEFQWSRATVSSIVSINIFLYGLIGPFAAALYQRFGLRRTFAHPDTPDIARAHGLITDGARNKSRPS